jgi:hypothetical protein
MKFTALEEDACVFGLSWYRYPGHLEICFYPLPFVCLMVAKRSAFETFAARRKAWCLFDYGGPCDPWQVSVLARLNDWCVGCTWYRDQDRLEINLSPLPLLTFLFTRLKVTP